MSGVGPQMPTAVVTTLCPVPGQPQRALAVQSWVVALQTIGDVVTESLAREIRRGTDRVEPCNVAFGGLVR